MLGENFVGYSFPKIQPIPIPDQQLFVNNPFNKSTPEGLDFLASLFSYFEKSLEITGEEELAGTKLLLGYFMPEDKKAQLLESLQQEPDSPPVDNNDHIDYSYSWNEFQDYPPNSWNRFLNQGHQSENSVRRGFSAAVLLLDLRRRWEAAIKEIERAPIDNFIAAGMVNSQVLGIFVAANEKMQNVYRKYMGEGAFFDYAKDMTERYFEGIYNRNASRVNIDVDQRNIDSFNEKLNAIRDCVNKLRHPEGENEETKRAYRNQKVNEIRSLFTSITRILDNLQDNFRNIDQGFGLVLAALIRKEKELLNLRGELENEFYSIALSTDFNSLLSKLEEIKNAIDFINGSQFSIKANPDQVKTAFWQDFSMEDDQVAQVLSIEGAMDKLREVGKKPINWTIGISCTNLVYKHYNRQNKIKEETIKEEARLRKINEEKAAAKAKERRAAAKKRRA